jgi:Ca2+-transporting ATPase
VEALGSVQVMYLDKTGTITMNRMTAVAIFTGMKYFENPGQAVPAEQ